MFIILYLPVVAVVLNIMLDWIWLDMDMLIGCRGSL